MTTNAESGDVEKNVYVTDVDISGGGGGARGAVNLRMAAGVELQSVKSRVREAGKRTAHPPGTSRCFRSNPGAC